MPSAASYRKPPLIQISPKTSKSSQVAKSLSQLGVGCGTLPDAVLINIVSLSRLATCSANVLDDDDDDDEAFARLPKIISRDRRAKRVGKKRETEECSCAFTCHVEHGETQWGGETERRRESRQNG